MFPNFFLITSSLFVKYKKVDHNEDSVISKYTRHVVNNTK